MIKELEVSAGYEVVAAGFAHSFKWKRDHLIFVTKKIILKDRSTFLSINSTTVI